MQKQKKGVRVRNFLMKRIINGTLKDEKLLSMKVADLINEPELAGIGKRTVQNMLKKIKLEQLPDKIDVFKISKKQRVWSFLEGLIEKSDLKSETLHRLSYQNLQGEPALQDIGKTTITCVISEFKKSYRENEGIPATTNQHVMLESVLPSCSDKQSIKNHSIDQIRSLIEQLETNMEPAFDKKSYDLRELKMALHYMGINHKKLLRAYWEDISQSHMSRILQ